MEIKYSSHFPLLVLHTLTAKPDLKSNRAFPKIYVDFTGEANKVISPFQDLWVRGANRRDVKEKDPSIKVITPVLDEILTTFYGLEIKKLSWSRNCGCSCGCSPGWNLKLKEWTPRWSAMDISITLDIQYPMHEDSIKLMLNNWKEIEETA